MEGRPEAVRKGSACAPLEDDRCVLAPLFRAVVAPRAGEEDSASLVLLQMHHRVGDIQVYGRLARCLLEGGPPPASLGVQEAEADKDAGGFFLPPPMGLSYQPGEPRAQGRLVPTPSGCLGTLPECPPPNVSKCMQGPP